MVFRMKSVCALIKRDWLLAWRVTKKELYRLNRLGKNFFSGKVDSLGICKVIWKRDVNMPSTFTFTFCIRYVPLCPKSHRC